jgi:plasmid stability protein
MPTLYVENVPRDLYEALRDRAKAQRRSISAEVLALLEDNVPTKKELKARQRASRKAQKKIIIKRLPGESHVPVVEMIREDRER